MNDPEYYEVNPKNSSLTYLTKKLCICSFSAIFLILLFIISPLSNFFKTSLFMKLIILVLLFYTIYLNIFQINILKTSILYAQTSEIKSQLNINIIGSYIFTGFLILLFLFIIKNVLRI